MVETSFIVKALVIGAIGLSLAIGAYGCARLIANMRREMEFVPPDRREFDWSEDSQRLSMDSDVDRKRWAELAQGKQHGRTG